MRCSEIAFTICTTVGFKRVSGCWENNRAAKSTATQAIDGNRFIEVDCSVWQGVCNVIALSSHRAKGIRDVNCYHSHDLGRGWLARGTDRPQYRYEPESAPYYWPGQHQGKRIRQADLSGRRSAVRNRQGADQSAGILH